MHEDDLLLREALKDLAPLVRENGVWASLQSRVAAKRRAHRRRLAFAGVAVVVAACLGFGAYGISHWWPRQGNILVITDEPIPGSTGQTTTAASEPPVAMFRGGLGRTGVYPSGGPSELPGVLWKFKAEGGVRTSPVVSDGVVYVGSTDAEASPIVSTLYALDAQSGREKWKFTGEGVSSPAVSDGVVYFGSGLRLYALDARSGEERWQFLMGAGSDSSPAVWGGMVYFGSQDGYFYALDAQSGTERWKFRTAGRIVSSPAVSGGVVYFDSEDGYLYALDAQSGGQKWKFTWSAAVDFVDTPAVSGGVVLVGGGPYLYALDSRSGEQKWRFDSGDGSEVGQPAISGGVVYVDGVALDIETGREQRTLLDWGPTSATGFNGSPVISGGVVYFGCGSHEGAFGPVSGSIYAVDLQSGQKIWEFDTGPVNNIDPAVSDGVLYVGDWDGYVYALK